MKTVLVTGSNGQLGKCFQKFSVNFSGFRFLFCTSTSLDITSEENLETFFEQNNLDYCINCAAYTNVEKAESEKEKAFLVNAEAVKNLAEICNRNNVVLIHFSTDYVFNGKGEKPYLEEDKTDAINVYGASKLKGEQLVQKTIDRYFIFRTSWLYSEFGKNFYNTILKKSEEKNVELKITTKQKGTPTNANDLALAVLQLLSEENKNYGLYHYSNLGEATWYDFAAAIIKNANRIKNVDLKASNEYKTVAKRPEYSVLSKNKSINILNLKIPFWEESLAKLQKNN